MNCVNLHVTAIRWEDYIRECFLQRLLFRHVGVESKGLLPEHMTSRSRLFNLEWLVNDVRATPWSMIS